MNTLNLVIDVQDPERPVPGRTSREMAPADRQRYIWAVRDAVAQLRDYGIPTLWVAIGDASQLYPARRPRAPDLLRRLKLTEAAPRPDEDIFQKRFMDGFTDIEDVRGNRVLTDYLSRQRPDGHAFLDAPFGQTTLTAHLKALEIDQVTIMGGMAEFCVTDNAIGAARNGFRPVIFPDLLISWKDATYTQPVWAKKHPLLNALEMITRLADIKNNPAARGIDPADTRTLAAIDTISQQPFAEFMATLKPPAAPKAKPSRWIPGLR